MKKVWLGILFVLVVCGIVYAGAWQHWGFHLSRVKQSTACNTTYGNLSGTSTSSISANMIRLRPITIDCSASTFSIKIRAQDIDTSSRQVILLVYDDDGAGGDPGTLLYKSSTAFYDATSAGAFISVTDPNGSASLTSGKYWVGAFYQSASSDIEYDASVGDSRRWAQASFGVDQVPSTWDTDNDEVSVADDAYYLDFGAGGANPVLTQIEPVPAYCDETATFQFSADIGGAITYGGSCGNADVATATAGLNTVTWTLENGTYSDCTVKVTNAGSDSNTLSVPSFISTSKYPIVAVHGWGGNPTDAWLCDDCLFPWLETQGYYPALMIANQQVNNSVLCNNAAAVIAQAQEVGSWVTETLAAFPGFEKVDLIGHSRGGGNIMQGLWFDAIDETKIRYVITCSGANKTAACIAAWEEEIPADETPGDALYSILWSSASCDQTSYSITTVDGAYEINLNPACHADTKGEARTSPTSADAARAAILAALAGGGDN